MTTIKATETTEFPRDHHTCPVWIGRLLVSPLRRLVENPQKTLGSAMGFHSLDLARLVGPSGRVVCVDLQEKMLNGLLKRARRKGLDPIIETRLCSQESLMLDDLAHEAELVTAFNVVHETAYPRRFLGECCTLLQPGGRLFIIEPKGHVSGEEFAETSDIAESLGLVAQMAPRVWKSHVALFTNPTD
jgi:ubiquinone/menaquinone biosynthesis C-methylase UbiE